jgi:hypothetical protein
MLIYRFLSGEDDSAFCHKVTKALSEGWQLHGGPTYAYDAVSKKMRRDACGQGPALRSRQEARRLLTGRRQIGSSGADLGKKARRPMVEWRGPAGGKSAPVERI